MRSIISLLRFYWNCNLVNTICCYNVLCKHTAKEEFREYIDANYSIKEIKLISVLGLISFLLIIYLKNFLIYMKN